LSKIPMPPAPLPRSPFFCPLVDSSSSSFFSLASLLCSAGERSEGEARIYFQVCMLICSEEAWRPRRIILFLDVIWHLGPHATHASMGSSERFLVPLMLVYSGLWRSLIICFLLVDPFVFLVGSIPQIFPVHCFSSIFTR
jgi:hypothetical protein